MKIELKCARKGLKDAVPFRSKVIHRPKSHFIPKIYFLKLGLQIEKVNHSWIGAKFDPTLLLTCLSNIKFYFSFVTVLKKQISVL